MKTILALAALCALPAAASETLKPAELEQAIYAFADRYAAHIAAATEAIGEDNPSAEQRRVAHLVKLRAVSSVLDIATDADPFGKLMDLVLLVTLQSYVWIDEDRAAQEFGARSEPLVRALRQMRVDAWKMAGRVLRPEQLVQLDALILDWRRQNPGVNALLHVRFDDVATGGGGEVLAELKPASSWFGLGEATKAVDEARLFGERAFYQAKRMPRLVNWQVEAVLNEALAKPQIVQAMQSGESLSRSVERLSGVAEKLPAEIRAEREALLATLEDRGGRLSGLLGEVRETAAAGDRLALSTLKVAESGERLSANVRETARLVESLMARQARAPAAKPFDVEPYVKAAGELNQSIEGINSALTRLDGLLERRTLLGDMNTALVDHYDHLFYRALLLIAAFFSMLLAYRLVSARFLKPR